MTTWTWLLAGALTTGTASAAPGQGVDLHAALPGGERGEVPATSVTSEPLQADHPAVLRNLAPAGLSGGAAAEAWVEQPKGEDNASQDSQRYHTRPTARLPEPSTLLLLLAGMLLGWQSRRKFA